MDEVTDSDMQELFGLIINTFDNQLQGDDAPICSHSKTCTFQTERRPDGSWNTKCRSHLRSIQESRFRHLRRKEKELEKMSTMTFTSKEDIIKEFKLRKYITKLKNHVGFHDAYMDWQEAACPCSKR